MKEKRVFITGASSGIGEAAMRSLVGNGCQVWGTSRNPERLPSLQGFHPLHLDLTDRDSIARASATALEEAGGFDVLINNAGSGVWGALEHHSPEQLREQFETLVFGPLDLIVKFLPHMRGQGGGLVINVTSLAAQFAVPYMGAYSAAKAAASMLTWNLRMEHLGEPLRFVDLQPGNIDTPFNDALLRTAVPEGEDLHSLKRARVYRLYDKSMRGAPPPERVARAIVKLVKSGSRVPERLLVGDLFQARIAPLLVRLVPFAAFRWGLRQYYGLSE